LQTIITITAIKTRPATVTPQIRPTKNINDYRNQNETSYCDTCMILIWTKVKNVI